MLKEDYEGLLEHCLIDSTLVVAAFEVGQCFMLPHPLLPKVGLSMDLFVSAICMADHYHYTT